jgi:hypothetical protein
LSRAADEARAGRYGCTVDVIPLSDGRVQLEVVDRVMDGERFRSEVMLLRVIDATSDDAVVSGTETLTELRAWAEQHNEERRARILAEESEADLPDIEVEEAERRAAAARELAAILQRAGD